MTCDHVQISKRGIFLLAGGKGAAGTHPEVHRSRQGRVRCPTTGQLPPIQALLSLSSSLHLLASHVVSLNSGSRFNSATSPHATEVFKPSSWWYSDDRGAFLPFCCSCTSQRQVLDDTLKMIPDCRKRLELAADDLVHFVVSSPRFHPPYRRDHHLRLLLPSSHRHASAFSVRSDFVALRLGKVG